MSSSEVSAFAEQLRDAAPQPAVPGHTVQFYKDDAALVGELSRFIGVALAVGDVAIEIATRKHREALAREFQRRGLDITRARQQGRYLSLDAQEALSQIMPGETIDPLRFREVVGGLIARGQSAAHSGRARVVIFGEMVALLWHEGKYGDALALERLWNELARTQSFSLHCAYPLHHFYRSADGEAFAQICSEHTAVIPAEPCSGGSKEKEKEEERSRVVAELQQKAQALETERALRESEQRFRFFVEAVRDYAIFMLDADGNVTTWNRGAERIKGYKASEIIGKHFSCFYPEEDLQKNKPQRELEIASSTGRFEDEGWRLRKDGSKFWANVIITAVKDHQGALLGFGKVTRDFTERRRAQLELQMANVKLETVNIQLEQEMTRRTETQQKLKQSEKSLRQLSLHLLRTQDGERKRIGRELHDSVGQLLTALKMKLDALRGAAVLNLAEFKEELRECAHLAQDSIAEVRTISYLLYPPMLEEMGLRSAIPWYVEGFTKRSGIETGIDIARDLQRFDRDAELVLFRVLQESLTNVHRHSGSRTASVRLGAGDGDVVLEIADQGKGIPRKILENGDEGMASLLGLRGMRERVEQLGGALEIHSSESGTMIRAVIPIEKILSPLSHAQKTDGARSNH